MSLPSYFYPTELARNNWHSSRLANPPKLTTPPSYPVGKVGALNVQISWFKLALKWNVQCTML